MNRDELVRSRDLMSNLAVRAMLGRALRPDKKPISRHTLISWRTTRGFPAPLHTPYVERELWARPVVKMWLEQHRPLPDE